MLGVGAGLGLVLGQGLGLEVGIPRLKVRVSVIIKHAMPRGEALEFVSGVE